MQYITTSAEETIKLGKNLATKLKGKAAVLALVGNLGAGKTTFVQGFAEGLGIKDKILSPTFVLVRQHKIPDTNSTLFHIDLYRLENDKDLKSLGLDELWSQKASLVLIEWAEKIKKLPENALYITFENLGGNRRKITTQYSLF